MWAGEVVDEGGDVGADDVAAVFGADFEGGGVGDDEFAAVAGLDVVDSEFLGVVSATGLILGGEGVTSASRRVVFPWKPPPVRTVTPRGTPIPSTTISTPSLSKTPVSMLTYNHLSHHATTRPDQRTFRLSGASNSTAVVFSIGN